MALTLENQRDMLKALLADVEARIAPPTAPKPGLKLAGLSHEEASEYFDRVTAELIGPRITIERNGTATLTNISYDDLRSVFTAAALYRSENSFQPASVPLIDTCGAAEANARDEHRWHIRTSVLCDFLDDAMLDGIARANAVQRGEAFHAKRIEKRKDSARKILKIRDQMAAAKQGND